MNLQTQQSLEISDLSTPLSEQQIKDFDELGVVKVTRAFDPQIAQEIESELWSRFSKWGISRGDVSSWERLDEPTIRQVMKRTRRVRGLESIYNERTDAVARTLAHQTDMTKTKALLLLTFSQHHEYISDEVVPSSIWHSDTPNIPGKGLAGVIVLGFINHVQPRGGGTMVITGSHRLFESTSTPITSKIAKRKLKKYDYFRDLFTSKTDRERFLSEPGCVRGVDLKVLELTGEPGEAYFVNGTVLHTITRNHQVEPRMMVRGFYGTSKLTEHYEQQFANKGD